MLPGHGQAVQREERFHHVDGAEVRAEHVREAPGRHDQGVGPARSETIRLLLCGQSQFATKISTRW